VQTAWTCWCQFRNLHEVVAMYTFGDHEAIERHLGTLYRTPSARRPVRVERLYVRQLLRLKRSACN
jgi:uncharacterized protein (DUF2132 family)